MQHFVREAFDDPTDLAGFVLSDEASPGREGASCGSVVVSANSAFGIKEMCNPYKAFVPKAGSVPDRADTSFKVSVRLLTPMCGRRGVNRCPPHPIWNRAGSPGEVFERSGRVKGGEWERGKGGGSWSGLKDGRVISTS